MSTPGQEITVPGPSPSKGGRNPDPDDAWITDDVHPGLKMQELYLSAKMIKEEICTETEALKALKAGKKAPPEASQVEAVQEFEPQEETVQEETKPAGLPARAKRDPFKPWK